MEASAWGRRSRRWRWAPTRRRPSSPGGSRRGPCCPLTPPRRARHPGAALGAGPFNGFSAAVPDPAGAGLLGHPPRRAGARGGRCPTTATGARRTRPTGCCASTACGTDFKTASAAAAAARRVEGFVSLSGSRRQAPVPARPRGPAADRRRRRPESIFEASDGTFWIGDEFGPWMLHFDRAGRAARRADLARRRALAAEPRPRRRARRRRWVAARGSRPRRRAERPARVRLPRGPAARRPRPAAPLRLRARPERRPVHRPPVGLPHRGPGLAGR